MRISPKDAQADTDCSAFQTPWAAWDERGGQNHPCCEHLGDKEGLALWSEETELSASERDEHSQGTGQQDHGYRGNLQSQGVGLVVTILLLTATVQS